MTLFGAIAITIVLAMLFGGPRKTAEQIEADAIKKNKTLDTIGLYLFVGGLMVGIPFFYMLLNDML